MAGLYIHIPFCKSRCVYCGFYSTTALDLRQRYVDALIKELAENSGDVETIYLGGGTPSQLTTGQLSQIFEAIFIYNKVADDAEVTMECNPDDITAAFADGLRSLPVNRISMGVQTFDDARLRFLHRRHNAQQVYNAIDLLHRAGIDNISIDLMYGFPEESMEAWEIDITEALKLEVNHLSSYCLSYEEGTPLHQLLKQGKVKETGEEQERQMYYTLLERLEVAGYEHYELSNFARKGFRSRHNSSYWQDKPYRGIGAAAHSYDLKSRYWNVADIRQYMEGIEQGKPIRETELIDDCTRYNDLVTTALRTKEGLSLTIIPEPYRSYCLRNARKAISNGLLELTEDQHLKLTREALFVSDMVMSELIYV